MCPAIGSGIVTGDAPYSYWPICFPGPYKQSQKPLRKSTRSSLFLFSKVANSVIFPLVAKIYIIQIQNKRTFTSTALDLVSSRV